MSIVIVCPHCSAKLRGDPDLAGREVECQRCHEVFRVGGDGPPKPVVRVVAEPSGARRSREDGRRPLFVEPPAPALNPWLLLALLLGGSVTLGAAALFGINALTQSETVTTAADPGATTVTPRANNGRPRNDTPPRLPLRSQERPRPPVPKVPPPGAEPAAADKAPDEGLSVLSTPPETTRKGETFRYQIRVRSRNGGVRYRILTGPPGMRVRPDGEVVWHVPNTGRPEQKVNVLVTDVDGNEVAHPFTLKLVGRGR